MLEFVSKDFYWKILDEGVLDELTEWNSRLLDLKHVQDAVAMHFLADRRDQDIAEVGGGASRVLPFLARLNRCSNIEPFEGADHGPVVDELDDSIVVIGEYLGREGSSIVDDSFDVVFSVSVVEHLNLEDLPSFFAECARILKPGGLMLHLIDLYLKDDAATTPATMARMGAYLAALDNPALTPVSEPQVTNSVSFSCGFATNSDLAMKDWNRIGPALADVRRTSQSCSLILAATKTS